MLVVAKCDIVPGFAAYFDDLSLEQRAQVGHLVLYDETLKVPSCSRKSSTRLMSGRTRRVLDRVEKERSTRRRQTCSSFPRRWRRSRSGL